MKQFLINRLYEASTYRGIIYLIAGITGMQVPPDQVEVVIAGAVALGGLIGSFLPDSLKKKE
jgi:hypothetical protein